MHRPRIMCGFVHVLYLHPVMHREASAPDQLPAPSRPTENKKGGEKRLQFDTAVRGTLYQTAQPVSVSRVTPLSRHGQFAFTWVRGSEGEVDEIFFASPP